MHTVIEQWTPKQAFLDATDEERGALFAKVGASLTGLEEIGARCIGASSAQAAPRASDHTWFAVWEMPDAAAVDSFFEVVEASGWFDYFDQANTVGELTPIADVLGQHMALRA
jgi:hypothetical protein